MKLATLKTNSRDGTLVVVNRDLTKATMVPEIAPTMQYALDNWSDIEPLLQNKYKLLNNNAISNAFAFNPAEVMSPLPRCYQWADGSAYVNHVELVRKSRGVAMPENFWTDPLMYQGGSDNFIGPHDSILVASEEFGIDFEAEVAIITDDVPMGISPQLASSAYERCLATRLGAQRIS
jgi:fumarylacetoacetate (FAA) hydrolase